MLSAEIFQAKISAITEKWDVLATKCEEHGLEMQCISGLAKEAMGLRALVEELMEVSKKKASKMLAKRKTTETEVVAEHARAKWAKHPPQIVEFEGDLHELEGKYHLPKRCNNVVDLRYTMLRHECDSLKRQIASGELCSETIVQRLANASKDDDALIDVLNLYAVYARKVIQDNFLNTSDALAQRL